MTQVAKQNEAVESNKPVEQAVDIIRGRMPLPIVQCIKLESADIADNALAKKYRTTAGKISDIRKGRNFEYISKTTVFSGDQLNDAVQYAEQLDSESEAAVKKVVSKMKPGSAEDEAKLKDARIAARKTKEGAKDAAEDASKSAPVNPKNVSKDVKDLVN